MTTSEKPFTDREREHYRSLVAVIIDGDAKTKQRLDDHARSQLAAVKQTLPGADAETLVIFLTSIAFVMARLMATPVGDVSEVIHSVFNNNVAAAAHAMGAYNFDDARDFGKPREGDAAPASAQPTKKEDDLIGMYL